MNFTFTQDQLDFQDAISSMLRAEVTADSIRARWQNESGVDSAFMQQAHDLGLNSMLIPESLGGLGLTPVDFVLLAEACGEVACRSRWLSRSWSPHRLWWTFWIRGWVMPMCRKSLMGFWRARSALPWVMPSTPASIMRTVRIGFTSRG